MNLLEKNKTALKVFILCVFFGCQESQDNLFVNIDDVTNTTFIEFDLHATNILIDSLRTDDVRTVLVGNYFDDSWGKISAKSYVEMRYDSGAVVADTLIFESLVFNLFVNDQLADKSSSQFEMDISNMRDSLFSEAVYLADREILSLRSYQNIDLTVGIKDTLVSFTANTFGKYLYDQIAGLSAVNLAAYKPYYALISGEDNESLLSFDLSAIQSNVVLYTKDSRDSTYVTRFVYNGVNFTHLERDRSTSDISSYTDLDTFNIDNEYTVINPAQGIFTVLDFSEVSDFFESQPDIMINGVELEAEVLGTTEDPVEGINFYNFREEGGISGNAFASIPLVTAGLVQLYQIFDQAANDFLVTDATFISPSNIVPVISTIEESTYSAKITLAMQDKYIKSISTGVFDMEKLVMIADDRVTLNESLIKQGSIKFKMYYTKVN
jgi:hypothetical protein